MNGAYGYDGMNTEKFSKNRVCNEHDALICQQHVDFEGPTVQIDEDAWIVPLDPRTFTCKTPLQCAYFTLDNAKYWYLNFVYNFMYKCLDMEKIHFIQGDTDSAYWAVAGSIIAGKHQQFEYAVSDRKFYDEHYADWFPDLKLAKFVETAPLASPLATDPDAWSSGRFVFTTLEGRKEEKKLLGLTIENESENLIALSPKCYTPFDDDEMNMFFKVKGINKGINPFTVNDYKQALIHPIQGRNIGFQVKNGQQMEVTVMKNALTGVHTKMVVYEHQACLPFMRLH
jgi:hypothetical protein